VQGNAPEKSSTVTTLNFGSTSARLRNTKAIQTSAFCLHTKRLQEGAEEVPSRVRMCVPRARCSSTVRGLKDIYDAEPALHACAKCDGERWCS
jgi:hypothetical protein